MSDGIPVALTAQSGVAIRPLDHALDAEAAAILADATGEGTIAAGTALITGARADDACAIYGLTEHDTLIAVYITRKIPLTLEISAIAVRREHRRKGHGRACLQDALRRAGKLPLVVETDDDTVGFYKRCGFKVVSRRVSPGGKPRFKLGWHAPGLGGGRIRPDGLPRQMEQASGN